MPEDLAVVVEAWDSLPEPTNLVQSRSFRDLLERSINKFHNRAIQTAQVIEELINLAKEMNAVVKLGEDLGLSDDELQGRQRRYER
jgi:type I site-specific restriction-modification system R (restriction) subunit